MEKRTILAVVLSLMVILIYNYFFLPKSSDIPSKKEKISEQTQHDTSKFLPSGKILSTNQNKDIGQTISHLLEEQQKEKPKDIFIETEKYKTVINTDGARISSWKLKNYFLTEDFENVPLKMSFWKRVGNSYKKYFLGSAKSDAGKQEKDHIDLFQSSDFVNEHGVQLIQGSLSEEAVRSKKNIYSGVFQTQAENILLNSEHPKESLKLTYLTANGFQIEKIFTFYHDSYQIDIDVISKNLKDSKDTLDYSLLLGSGLGNSFQKGAHKYEGPVTWLQGNKIKDKPGKIQHSSSMKEIYPGQP